jgi:hypothetical protein
MYSDASEYVVAVADAEEEGVGIWAQAVQSLYLCLVLIGPAMLSVILLCYPYAYAMKSQQVASVGVIYTLVFLLLMCVFSVAVLPCILLSRLFISVVAPTGLQV